MAIWTAKDMQRQDGKRALVTGDPLRSCATSPGERLRLSPVSAADCNRTRISGDFDD